MAHRGRHNLASHKTNYMNIHDSKATCQLPSVWLDGMRKKIQEVSRHKAQHTYSLTHTKMFVE